jgi:uncharacterized membrane protein YeaQ/YmgE (transglycosylase-associated protein family)
MNNAEKNKLYFSKILLYDAYRIFCAFFNRCHLRRSGQALAGYNLGGCLVSIVVGFIGAYIGMWIAGKFGLPPIFEISVQGKPFPVIWSVIGSAVFTLIVGLLRRVFIGNSR